MRRIKVRDYTLLPYLSELRKVSVLDRREERRLAKRSREGDREAHDRLIISHLPFVVDIATEYMNQGLPLADLINEGNLGLIEAVKRFDEERNVRLATYAVWWIRYRIFKALANRGLVRLPQQIQRGLREMRFEYLKFLNAHGREPSDEELREIAARIGMKPEYVFDIFTGPLREVSLDASSTDDSSLTLEELLSSETFPSPEQRLSQQELREELNDVLSMLSEREREVLNRYFGLTDGIEHTLQEIGDALGITREAVRLIKVRALRKLRGQIVRRELKELFQIKSQ